MSIAFQVLGQPGKDNALLVTVNSGQAQHHLLFDCGEGCLDTVDRSTIQSIDGLFFSHFHIDHVAGFDSFFRCNWYRTGGPVRIFGPPDTRRVIHFRIQAYTWNMVDSASSEVLVSEIDEEQISAYRYCASEGFEVEHACGVVPFRTAIREESDYRVEALHLDHGLPCMAYTIRESDRINVNMDELSSAGFSPGPWLKQVKDASVSADETVELPDGIETVGDLRERLLVRQPGDSIAYLTDFRVKSDPEQERLVEFLKGCKVLVCENNFSDADRTLAEKSHHMTSSEIGRIAALVQPDQLVVFHVSDRYTEPEWQAQLSEVQNHFDRSGFPEHWCIDEKSVDD